MGFLKDRDLTNVPTIYEYYKGKTIFITGGSGFMGKVLVEKLLYSCSELDRIYLLLRNKKGVNAEDRLAALYASKKKLVESMRLQNGACKNIVLRVKVKSPKSQSKARNIPVTVTFVASLLMFALCFDRLRKDKPDIFQKKVFCIAGDCSEIGLGICAEDRILIVNRTNIIFHVAASVRFDDLLKTAARLNLRGTREMVELAKEVRNLEVLVHVSTSYANTNRKRIEEVTYPAFADWRDTLDVCENIDDNTLNALTPKYLGELPNTYVFTKQLAEHVMAEQKGQLPIVIMRPSIVISSFSEPVVGWVENLNGPVGILIAGGKGILRTMYIDPDLEADYIPVDTCIKAFITAAWARGTQMVRPTDEIEVYNCSSSHMKTMTMGEISEYGKKVMLEVPLENMLWFAGWSLTKSRFEYYVKVLLLHLLPAILVDLVLRISGNKPMLVKLQRRIYIANIALRYFISQQWIFTNQNIIELRGKIKKEDQDHFFYEMETINLVEFFKNACIGGKKFIFNEKMENLPKAKIHYKRMELLHKVVKTAIQVYALWFVVNIGIVKRFLQSVFI